MGQPLVEFHFLHEMLILPRAFLGKCPDLAGSIFLPSSFLGLALSREQRCNTFGVMKKTEKEKVRVRVPVPSEQWRAFKKVARELGLKRKKLLILELKMLLVLEALSARVSGRARTA